MRTELKDLQGCCHFPPDFTFQMSWLSAFDAQRQNDQYEIWRHPFCSLPNSSNNAAEWLELDLWGSFLPKPFYDSRDFAQDLGL